MIDPFQDIINSEVFRFQETMLCKAFCVEKTKLGFKSFFNSNSFYSIVSTRGAIDIIREREVKKFLTLKNFFLMIH